MTDEQPQTPAQIELDDALHSVRATGENADSKSTEDSTTNDSSSENASAQNGESSPNPPLPDWGSDGVAAEDEPAQ